MKRIVSVLICACLAAGIAMAQTANDCYYTEATAFTLVGKLFPDTPNPYHRIDTVRFKGFTPGENLQVREPAGMAVAFRTDSPFIRILADYGTIGRANGTMPIAVKGYDLYIKKDGKWLWAAAATQSDGREELPLTLMRNMDGSMHECLLYLPLLSELYSVQIGVANGSSIEALPNPFRHRVVIHGSSFTHGISTSRAGMTYPAQFVRATGIQLLGLGCSGNCKMQPYFADALCEVDAEAFIFDSFSNPTEAEIKERLFPFIEKIQAAHPGKPLIFQQTIYRESRNFNTVNEQFEASRLELVDSLMTIACKKYKDVYYIRTTNATAPSHETSVDGVHPDNYGYSLWAESIRKPILKILRKYGIK